MLAIFLNCFRDLQHKNTKVNISRVFVYIEVPALYIIIRDANIFSNWA